MTDSVPNFPVMGYMDICLACRTRYQCLISPQAVCPGFVPVDDCDFKVVFSEEPKEIESGMALAPACKAILITGYNKRYEIQGQQTDAGVRITTVKTEESGIRTIV